MRLATEPPKCLEPEVVVGSAQPERVESSSRPEEGESAGHPEGNCLKLHVEEELLPVVCTKTPTPLLSSLP